MPSCPTFMWFALAARDRPVSGGRDERGLSVFHMPCKHRPLHVDFKHRSPLWNSSRFLRRFAVTVDSCSRLLAFRGKPKAKSEGSSILRKQVADIERQAFGGRVGQTLV